MTRANPGVDCCEDCGWTDYWPVCPSCKMDRDRRAAALREALRDTLGAWSVEIRSI